MVVFDRRDRDLIAIIQANFSHEFCFDEFEEHQSYLPLNQFKKRCFSLTRLLIFK